jgi:hypothetical protein
LELQDTRRPHPEGVTNGLGHACQHDFYSIKAKDDLPVGHMVLIEHVLWGDINLVANGVARDDNLFATVYPWSGGTLNTW